MYSGAVVCCTSVAAEERCKNSAAFAAVVAVDCCTSSAVVERCRCSAFAGCR